MKMKTLIFSLSILFATTSFSQTGCSYNVQLGNSAIQVSDDDQVIQHELQLSRGAGSSSDTCSNYRIFFSKGQANSYQRQAINPDGVSINYNLHKDINQNGILKEFADALSETERLQGSMPDVEVFYNNPFYISIPGISSQNFPPYGSYTDNVQVSLYALNSTTGQYGFEKAVSFSNTFNVPQRLFISLVDTGGPFDASSTTRVMDFADLTQPSSKAADLIVLSNTPYEVFMSSTNNGVLKHSKGETINYTLSLNGSIINLSTSASSPVTVSSGGATTASGNRNSLQVEITGNNTLKPSGLYQDTITITAIAN